MTIKIYDSHTHLNDEAFYGDVGAFLARAKHYGVTELNMIGSNRLLNDRALKLASTYPGLYAVIGFHPEDLAEVTPTDWEGLKKVLRRPEVVGVGEVGLDFVNGIADHRAQEAALVEQIDLANQLSLPVVIHCREALAETYRVLVEHPVKAGRNGRTLPDPGSVPGEAKRARLYLLCGRSAGQTLATPRRRGSLSDVADRDEPVFERT